jgi:DNA-binding NarL/FixJ family response regulator
VSVKYEFLLVGNATEMQWFSVLQRALLPLGKLRSVSEEEAIQAVTGRHYDVIIIDATAIRDVASLVLRLHAQQHQARIVVATASPTWQRAREVLRAGALDYIRKSLDEKDLRSKIQAVVEASPPPWSREENSLGRCRHG